VFGKGIGETDQRASSQFALEQNFPNPFNPSTEISYTLPDDEFVSVKVYDVLGREVAAIVNEFQTADSYAYNFDAANLSSGAHLCRINAEPFSDVRKMMLMR
jgi:hypothetical protein